MPENSYPYEFVDHISKLAHVGSPPKEAFYSSLYKDNVSDENYEHALLVFKTMLCVLFKDYHLLYLKTDVLLLADVFENFRSMCISDFKLDPAHYMSRPGYSWDSCMLMTKAKLDLITDPSILDMIDRSKRGGLCYVWSKRYVKANNHYLPDDDDSQEENNIIYEDANSLNAWAMTQALPYKYLRFETTSSLRAILDTPDDGPFG